MATTTTSYSFNTPTEGTEEDNWGDLLNANWDKADDLLDGTTAVVCIRLARTTMAGTALDPDPSNLQELTLTGDVTLTDSLADGDQLLLRIVDGDTHAITWPTLSWVGSGEPTLTGNDIVTLFKLNATLYGVYTGAVS